MSNYWKWKDTFWASSEQHESLHLVNFLGFTSLPIDNGVLQQKNVQIWLFEICCERNECCIRFFFLSFTHWLLVTVVVFVFVIVVEVAVVVTATAVVVVVVVVTLVFWLTSFGWLIESDRDICGLLECKIFVKPPPAKEPFGESLVTTTDGARTRLGLKMAGISLSRVISLHEMNI